MISKIPPNKELFENLLLNNFVIVDLGDGAWAWSEKAELQISRPTRTLLDWLLYGDKIEGSLLKFLEDEGFNKEGFYLGV